LPQLLFAGKIDPVGPSGMVPGRVPAIQAIGDGAPMSSEARVGEYSGRPFICLNCNAPIDRGENIRFTCPRCKSEVLVPPAGNGRSEISLAGQRMSMEADNQVNRISKFPFVADYYGHPLLRAYRREFPFDQMYRGARDEFAALVNFRDLHRTAWYRERPGIPFLKRYHLRRLTRRDDFWYCTHFARVFTMSAAALAWPARIVNVMRPVKWTEKAMGHMVVDIWSNQYQKWIYMDVLHNFHYENESGEPLDLLEARDLLFNHRGQGLYLNTLKKKSEGWKPGLYHLGEAKPDDYTRLLQERSLNTFWCLFYHAQDYFTNPLEERRVPILIYRDRLTAGREPVGESRLHYADEPLVVNTANALDIYPTMNNAELQVMVDPKDSPGRLRVYIATQTPNLKQILYRQDGGAWKKYPVDGLVVPMAGRKRVKLEAVTENLAGRRGRPSRLGLSW